MKPIDQVRAMLRSLPTPDADTPLSARRVGMDAFGESARMPAGVNATPIDLGCAAVHLRGAALRDDHAILYLHGGGYVLGSPRSHQALAARIAAAARAEVFVPDYRLAPEHPFPAAITDAAGAFDRLLARGLDARKLAIAGDSAGGGLAMAAALTLRDRGAPAPGGLVLLSPWLDLSNNHPSYAEVGARDPILRKDDLDRMAAHYLNGADAADPRASPIGAALHNLAPILLQVGADELFIGEARDFAARARAAGAAVELDVWPEMIHVFQAFADWLPEGDDAIAKIGAFLQARWQANT